MKYKIYKFDFITGVHFGKKSLEDAEYTLGADTIFSAMCHEFLRQGEEYLKSFVSKAMEGKIKISDAFPYIGNTYYIPKPMLKIEAEMEKGDSVLKKAYKKLAYIPVDAIETYLNGKLDVEKEKDKLKDGLGKKVMKVSASIRGEKETVPYRIGMYSFKENSGLYIILGYEEEDDEEQVEECLEALSFSGIGGKRNSGLGRFELKPGKISDKLLQKLNSQRGSRFMTLSGSLPKEEELDSALENAHYLLIKRSGFVASETYAVEQLRKRDLYVMKSGSCFQNLFEGDIYDVSDGGAHPVYRYAKPLFLEVIS